MVWQEDGHTDIKSNEERVFLLETMVSITVTWVAGKKPNNHPWAHLCCPLAAFQQGQNPIQWLAAAMRTSFRTQQPSKPAPHMFTAELSCYCGELANRSPHESNPQHQQCLRRALASRRRFYQTGGPEKDVASPICSPSPIKICPAPPISNQPKMRVQEFALAPFRTSSSEQCL